MAQPEGHRVEARGDVGGGEDDVLRGMRDVLTLSTLARGALARRLGMSVHDLEAVEHVMTAQALGGDHAELVGPAELARRLGVTTAATTQSVQRLEAAGHLVRRPHPQDRRRQVLEVTDSGRAHVFAALQPLLAMVRAQNALLTPAERRAAAKFLDGQQAAYRQYLAFLNDPGPQG